MKPYLLLLGASVALAACDSQPTVTQPIAPPAKQELSAAEQDAIAEKVAQRLAQQRSEEARVDAAREAEIREQVRREVEEEFARREAQTPPPQQSQTEEAETEPPQQQGKAVQVSTWGPERAGYDMFYESLSPHGAWYETNELGFVWQPTVASRNPSWRPYLDGQWADSDQGWIWVSQEPFGWATYHYGRWASLENIGWVWVPGTEWAPAWVSWRETDDYIGWAPLPPRSFQAGTSVGAWVDETYDIGPECYNFIPVVQFHMPTYRTVVVNYVENIRIIERTRNVTNIHIKNSKVYLGGPRYDTIKVRCPGLIKTRPIARVNSRDELKGRGNKDTIVVYSPKIDRKDGRPQEIVRKLDRPRVRTGWEGVHDPTTKVRLQATMSGKERVVEQKSTEVVHQKTTNRDEARKNDNDRSGSANDKSRGDRNDPVRVDQKGGNPNRETVVTYEQKGQGGNRDNANKGNNEEKGRRDRDNEEKGRLQARENEQKARDNDEKNRRARDNEEKGRQARENEERNRRERENEQRAQQARQDEERSRRDRDNEERGRKNREEEEVRNRRNAEEAREKARQVARLEQGNKNKEEEEKKKRK